MKPLKFLYGNKVLSIIISIGISILLIGVIGNYLVQSKLENWPKQNKKEIESIIASIKQTITFKQDKLLLEKERIKSKLERITDTEFQSFQEALEFADPDLLKIAVFKDDSLIYWNEKYIEKLKFDDTLNFDYGESYFLSSDINTYLSIKDTMKFDGILYQISIFQIIEKYYQLNEDFFENVSLSEELKRKVGVDIDLAYEPTSERTKDGRKQSFTIQNNKDSTIGIVTFVKPSRQDSISEVEKNIGTIQGILAIIGFLLLGIILRKELLLYQNKSIKILFLFLYLVVFRYLLILTNFPQSLFNYELFTDKYYYSYFGNGLANSPIDLFVTLICVFFFIVQFFQHSFDFFKSKKSGEYSKLKSLPIIIITVLLYLLFLRGIGAAVRGSVFDTTLRYFQSTSLSLTLPHLLMHTNILLLGLISLLGSSAFVMIILQYIRGSLQKLKPEQFIYLFIFMSAGIVLFHYLQNTPQLTIPIKILQLCFVMVCVYALINLEIKRITEFVLFYITASIFSVAALLFYNTELEKSSLKTTANIISRYDDDWYKSLIKETLLSNFTRIESEKAFKNIRTNFNSSAFKIWSKSQLQQEAINSSVNFISLSGNLLGGFGSIYPSISLDRFIDTNTIIEEIQIFEEPTESESQKLIRGIFPVKDEFAFLGYIDVSIFADINDFGFSSHPTFISTGKLNEKAILKLNKLMILDYRNAELKIVYGNLNPNLNFNRTILNAKFTDNNDTWIEINFNDADYLIYLKKFQVNKIDRILAVALREKELSISLFDFFKVFFSHSLILIGILLIYFIYFYQTEFKYQFDLRKKLLFAFLIISVIPLILTAFYFRNLTEEKNEIAIYYKLGKRAFSIDEYLNDNFSIFNGTNIYQRAADDLNINFTVYRQNIVEYSTNDLIYDVGLLPKIINPKAYDELILKGSQEILVSESVDKFKFNSFYYKTSLINGDIIIKVTDGFNNILLPFSGSEVDVFLFGFYSLAVLLIIIFSAIFANQISRPLRKITMATKSVAAGDLSLELKTNAKGELGDLVSGFQFMIRELKKNQTILAEIEREEAWKEMAKQVAHEIKNPLTPMKLSVQQLIAAFNDKSDKFNGLFQKVTATLLNQIETLKNIATEFSNFARMPKLKLEQINCVEIINQSINLFTDENITIIFNRIEDNLIVNGDSEQLRRTIINLIRNSIQAEATKITLDLIEEINNYELIISDNGTGISQDNLPKIFEPNFTTKKEGMGLGLSLARRYLRSTGGDILIEKASEHGTIIKLIFPK